MNFEEKVKSMKVHEIVDSMIQGIRKEWVEISFGTFGHVINGLCYGCGATNAICEIIQESFPNDYIKTRIRRSDFLEVRKQFLDDFEHSIDSLRRGCVYNFTSYLHGCGLIDYHTEIEIDEYEMTNTLPYLDDDVILENYLFEYENFRDWLKERDL